MTDFEKLMKLRVQMVKRAHSTPHSQPLPIKQPLPSKQMSEFNNSSGEHSEFNNSSGEQSGQPQQWALTIPSSSPPPYDHGAAFDEQGSLIYNPSQLSSQAPSQAPNSMFSQGYDHPIPSLTNSDVEICDKDVTLSGFYHHQKSAAHLKNTVFELTEI